MSDAQANALRKAAEDHEIMLIVGGTGSGKTTLANAILALPQFSEDRVFLIEDTDELQCSAADKVELLTKTSFPPVNMTDLRSEEHKSELQSLMRISQAVFCLKKKTLD